jgi:ADP-ribose pyrophosphatase YjhB (NUDIX family)
MKLPKQAKLVFKGKIFDVYQWPQRMYDGSVTTFEALKRPDGVRIIATQGNKIILNQEKQPNAKKAIGTFGGRVDAGETPLACAKRELLEEAGLESKDWKLLKTVELYPEKMDCKIYTFIAKNCRKTKKPSLDPGEKIKTVSVNLEKFIKIAQTKSPYLFPFINNLRQYFAILNRGHKKRDPASIALNHLIKR